MSTKSLEFTKEKKWSVASFNSPGTPCVVQIQQKEAGDVNVFANAEGMEPTRIGNINNYANPNVIFNVEVPEGLTITVQSFGEVECAKIVVEES